MAQVMREQDLGPKLGAPEAQRQAVVDPQMASERAECSDTRLLHAIQSGDAEGEWRAQRWRLRDAWEVGLPDQQHGAITRMFDLVEELGRPDLMSETLLEAVMIALAEGRFADVDALHGKALNAGDEVPDDVVAWQRVRAGWETGDIDPRLVSVALGAVPPSVRLVLHPWVELASRSAHGVNEEARVFTSEFGLDELPNDDGRHAALCMAADLAATADSVPMCAAIYESLLPYADLCAVDAAVPRVWFGSTRLYLGMLASATGDVATAREHLERARYLHTLMGARCLVVRGMMWEARIARRRGEHRVAAHLLDSAGRAADALGMRPLADRCRSRPDAPERNNRRDPAHRRWQFRKDGATWLITTAKTQARINDRKGVGYLHRLITQPGQELHVLDLAGAGDVPVDGGSGPVLDATAKAEYWRRIEDLRDQVEEGEQWGDHERVERARAELDSIAYEISAATGLGGRDRPSDAGERARVSVRKAIRAALALIDDAVPEVGSHLEASVRTGYYCAYDPDPHSPVPWGA